MTARTRPPEKTASPASAAQASRKDAPTSPIPRPTVASCTGRNGLARWTRTPKTAQPAATRRWRCHRSPGRVARAPRLSGVAICVVVPWLGVRADGEPIVAGPSRRPGEGHPPGGTRESPDASLPVVAGDPSDDHARPGDPEGDLGSAPDGRTIRHLEERHRRSDHARARAATVSLAVSSAVCPWRPRARMRSTAGPACRRGPLDEAGAVADEIAARERALPGRDLGHLAQRVRDLEREPDRPADDGAGRCARQPDGRRPAQHAERRAVGHRASVHALDRDAHASVAQERTAPRRRCPTPASTERLSSWRPAGDVIVITSRRAFLHAEAAARPAFRRRGVRADAGRRPAAARAAPAGPRPRCRTRRRHDR